MKQKTEINTGGIGFFGLLTILFIGLKLAGIIDWSWWLVLLPAYGGLVLVLGLMLIVFIATLILQATKK